MKKFLFLTVAAAMAFAACNKTEVVYTDGPQEIAMFAVNNVATKAPVADTEYMDTQMEVAAYLASGESPQNYFGKTAFIQSGEVFTGSQYWPVTDATINFLAISEPASDSPLTISFDNTNYASGATVVLADNSVKQYDLMYAAGQGVKDGSNPGAVDMVFKHAQSWICFKVKAQEKNKITVKSITLNGAIYDGTVNFANSKYNATAEYTSSEADVTVNWSTKGLPKNVSVKTGEYICTTSPVAYGDGLLVVPNEATSAGFTIVYSTGAGDITFTDTFDSPVDGGWKEGKKYTYVIEFGSLEEIKIKPTVNMYITDLNSNSTDDDDIPVVIQ